MKKLFCVLSFLVIFISAETKAQMHLNLPDNIQQQSSLLYTSQQDNISYSTDMESALATSNNDLQSNLALRIPEAAKTQSEISNIAKMYVGLYLNLGLPLGNAGNVYKTGFGFTAQFTYALYSYLWLQASLGYLSYGYSNSGLYGGSASFSDVPFIVSARYLFAAGGAITPYVLAELGLHFSSASYTVDYGPFFGGSRTVSASSSDFEFGFGGGAIYPVSSTILLDGNLRFWLISGFNQFVISLGAHYALGM